MSNLMSSREKQEADNNLFNYINRRIWGWYKSSNGRVTIPPQVLDEFPAGVEFGWRVIRNREEIRVALDKGLFDNGKMLLGEPRSSE